MNPCTEPEMDIVNIVASGDLGREFDLEPLSAAIEISKTEYEPENFPGLITRFEEDGPVIMLFASGSYTLMGVTTPSEMENLFHNFISSLSELGINIEYEKSQPTVQNIICKNNLNKEVNLDKLSIELGLENTEYEPEQSPFLYYWPPGYNCLITIPTNGEVIVTGVQDIESAGSAFDHLCQLVK